MSQPATQRAGEEPLATSIGDFDHHADTYREDVENAIAWSGKDVDYFAEGKADLLVALTRRRLGDPAKLSALDVGCGVGVTDRFLADLHAVQIGPEARPQVLRARPLGLDHQEQRARRRLGVVRYEVVHPGPLEAGGVETTSPKEETG